MPRVIALEDARPAALGECVEALRASGFDPGEEDSLLHAARWLRRLGNDRRFLADLLLAELAARHRADSAPPGYGPQVIMLSPPGGDFFLRANIWPSADEHCYRASGGGPFAYGLAHDHNFHFLTLGYFGPGYWSDYWEYDRAGVTGAVGERVPLRFVERSRLEPGKLLHYRALRDVHAQAPPDALSVSLNVMHSDPARAWSDQYAFDTARGTISQVLGLGAAHAWLRVAVGLGGAEARDLAERFARGHPCERMRLTALEAQAGVLEPGERDALWRRAEGSGSRLVAAEAKARRRALAVPGT